MASKQQTVKLYWCTTADHDEDWFIFAESARSAKKYHEYYEGYGAGDARARLMVRDVPLTKFTNGEPPCHAQMRELMALGFEDAGSVPDRRKVRFEGKTYTEGILESLVVRGRQQMAVKLQESRSLELKKACSSAAEPESAPGVKARPRLVS
jgi:hypothetical protein